MTILAVLLNNGKTLVLGQVAGGGGCSSSADCINGFCSMVDLTCICFNGFAGSHCELGM